MRTPSTPPGPTDAQRAVDTGSARRGRLWLADDSASELALIRGLLAEAYDLETFPDGASLLERLARPDVLTPDLLLLDWHMPGISGLEVCRFLRERFSHVALPILVLTASTHAGDLEEAFAAGANDFVAKPARGPELLARVRTHLEVRRHAEALRLREAEAEAERTRLADILSTLHEGLLVQDARGVLRFSNATAERLLGLSAAQLAGRTSADPYWAATWPDGRPAPAEEHPPMRALRTGQAVEGDILGVRHADGRRLWLSINARPLFARDGKTPSGVVSSFLDVTAQWAAEAERTRLLGEMQAARERLTSLFEGAPAIICTFRGPELVYELSNPLHDRLVGLGRRLVGRPVREAVPEAVGQGIVALLKRVYRTGEPYFGRELPLRLDRRGDGTLVDAFVDVVYQPARDATGSVVGVDVFGFDVTEQVHARHEVETLARRLLESEERLRRVVEASSTGTWELDVASGDVTAGAGAGHAPGCRHQPRGHPSRGPTAGGACHLHRARQPARRCLPRRVPRGGARQPASALGGGARPGALRRGGQAGAPRRHGGGHHLAQGRRGRAAAGAGAGTAARRLRATAHRHREP